MIQMNAEFDKVPRDRLTPNPKAELREQFHEVARYRQLSLRTEGGALFPSAFSP